MQRALASVPGSVEQGAERSSTAAVSRVLACAICSFTGSLGVLFLPMSPSDILAALLCAKKGEGAAGRLARELCDLAVKLTASLQQDERSTRDAAKPRTTSHLRFGCCVWLRSFGVTSQASAWPNTPAASCMHKLPTGHAS